MTWSGDTLEFRLWRVGDGDGAIRPSSQVSIIDHGPDHGAVLDEASGTATHRKLPLQPALKAGMVGAKSRGIPASDTN